MTTRDERVQIIALRDSAKMTWKEIERVSNVDFRTSQSIYSQAKITDTPSNQKGSDRPVIFTEEEKARVEEYVT